MLFITAQLHPGLCNTWPHFLTQQTLLTVKYVHVHNFCFTTGMQQQPSTYGVLGLSHFAHPYEQSQDEQVRAGSSHVNLQRCTMSHYLTAPQDWQWLFLHHQH